MAWAASSSTLTPCFLAMAMMASISQGTFERWTGITAFVFSVMLASKEAGSRFSESLTSANTGTARALTTTLTVAMKVTAGTMTSSPSCTRKPTRPHCRAAVPEETPTAYLAPVRAIRPCSKASDFFSRPGP